MKVFGIVGAIRDHCAAGNTFDQRRAKQPFAAMTWAGDQADGGAEAVGGRVELGSQPAFSPSGNRRTVQAGHANARLIEPSTKAHP